MSGNASKAPQQKIAEADVDKCRQELGPFVVAAETTRMPMVFTNAREANNLIVFANDSFLKLTGYDRVEVLGQPFNFIVAVGDGENTAKAVEMAFADPSREGPDIHFRRKDESEGSASMFVDPVKDQQGKLVQYFVSLVDITHFQTAEKNGSMLIDELNHRVKNTLATVQSIVTQAVRNSSDPLVIRESIETRIAALSRPHDLLRSNNWEGTGLRDLLREALAPFAEIQGSATRVSLAGKDILLSPKATLGLGIAFNEVATNAVKYGAVLDDAGSISIKWTMETKSNGRWLCLRWSESGGPKVTTPQRRGFGSRVIEEGLAHELEGEIKLEFLSAGIVRTINVPASATTLNG